MRRWWLGAIPPAVVLLLLGPPFVFEARLAMPLRGIRGGVFFPLPTALLLVAVGVAVAQAIALHRAHPAHRLALALCAVPLLVALPSALGPDASGLEAHIERLGEAGTMQLWALLTVAALLAALSVGLAADRLVEWRSTPNRPAWRPGRAAVAAALSGAFVVLILRTSTGLDFLSSWTRWGAIGVAMLASAVVALTPSSDEETEPATHALLFACIGVSLLAQREYVAALSADTLTNVDPFLDPAPYEHSLREIAWAVEPRERYGWALALLPFLMLGAWVRAPRRAALPLALSLALLGASYGISHTLDRRAERDTAPLAASEAPSSESELLEWSRRAIPRSVPWLRAMRPDPVRCAAWSAPP